MIPSPRGIAFVKGYEKCERKDPKTGLLHAYKPIPKDPPTIGWGSTGADIKMGTIWTQAQADERFDYDAEKFTTGVNEMLGQARTNQDQWDALFSFAYNAGLENLRTSTLLRLHKAGDFAGAAQQFARWDHAGGKVVAGLTRRRSEEALLYKGKL